MTTDDIKTCIANWITDAGFVAVKLPTNTAAQNGKYFAVGVNHLTQYGNTTKPSPSEALTHKRVAQYVATVVVHEVAGSGDTLRKLRNDFGSEEFLAFVRGRFNVLNDELDHAFSVWDIGDIVDETINDSDFFIQQYVLSFRVSFNDFIDDNKRKVLSASGTVGPDDFYKQL